MRKVIAAILLNIIILNLCSCSLLKKPIDKRIGFLNNLKITETYIRSEEWDKAKIGLKDSKNTWGKIKPMLQIDVDHDYINAVEEDLIKLGAYLDTEEKSESLATILLLQDIWENIGSL